MGAPESEQSAAPGTPTRPVARPVTRLVTRTVVRTHHPSATHPALLRTWELARSGDVNGALGDLETLRVLAVLEADSADAALLLAIGLDCRLARGDVGEALVLLRDVEAYAGRRDLWPLTARVRRLLERLGEEPRPVHSEAHAALTVSERRIARLAALGRTNRQVGQELGVGVKAVEGHLSHVYRKLGIRSRTGLAGSLGVPD